MVGGVSEPHGLDISGYDVGRLVAGGEVEVLDGSVEGVGVGFGEHGEQFLVLSGCGSTILFLKVSM